MNWSGFLFNQFWNIEVIYSNQGSSIQLFKEQTFIKQNIYVMILWRWDPEVRRMLGRILILGIFAPGCVQSACCSCLGIVGFISLRGITWMDLSLKHQIKSKLNLILGIYFAPHEANYMLYKMAYSKCHDIDFYFFHEKIQQGVPLGQKWIS